MWGYQFFSLWTFTVHKYLAVVDNSENELGVGHTKNWYRIRALPTSKRSGEIGLGKTMQSEGGTTAVGTSL